MRCAQRRYADHYAAMRDADAAVREKTPEKMQGGAYAATPHPDAAARRWFRYR
jgi:hypothetical protein